MQQQQTRKTPTLSASLLFTWHAATPGNLHGTPRVLPHRFGRGTLQVARSKWKNQVPNRVISSGGHEFDVTLHLFQLILLSGRDLPLYLECLSFIRCCRGSSVLFFTTNTQHNSRHTTQQARMPHAHNVSHQHSQQLRCQQQDETKCTHIPTDIQAHQRNNKHHICLVHMPNHTCMSLTFAYASTFTITLGVGFMLSQLCCHA